MNVHVEFISILADWIGVPNADIDLSPGATLGDLTDAIGNRYRDNMPHQLWDERQNAFAQPIYVEKNGVFISSRRALLAEGDQIRFWPGFGGG